MPYRIIPDIKHRTLEVYEFTFHDERSFLFDCCGEKTLYFIIIRARGSNKRGHVIRAARFTTITTIYALLFHLKYYSKKRDLSCLNNILFH